MIRKLSCADPPYFRAVSFFQRMASFINDVTPRNITATVIGSTLELAGPCDDVDCIAGHIQELCPFELKDQVFRTKMEKAKASQI